MKNAHLKLVVHVLLTTFAISVFAAGQTTPPQPDTVDAAKIEKIKEVLRLTHTEENTTRVMREMMAREKRQLPLPTAAQDDFERLFLEKLNAETVVKIAIPIYAETFSSEELDGLIAFYKTPTGQKLIEKSPQLTMSIMTKCGDLGRQVGTEIGTEIGKKLKAGDYGPWPPPEKSNPAQEKQSKN